ncbi:HAD family hydrolase [Niabella aurantiaca]|uniref:HAD family hydrolase n=1 Tax=Niabella aurantiaca TaxID=379900 RepID=UPI000378E971|nr:HAD family hydrolase [Niabella aurantiaca]
MHPTNSGYIVSDICDTLFYSNTTFDFISFCIRKKKVPTLKIASYRLFLSKTSPFFYCLAVLQKIRGKDYLKARALKIFKGVPIEKMEQWTEEFYTEILRHSKIQETHTLLNRFDPEKIILASSTIEPVAKLISKKLPAGRYVATSLEIKGNVYTGKIRREISARKMKAIEEITAPSEMIHMAISDNHTDRQLLETAIEKIAICYKKSDILFWKKIPGITILTLSRKH